VAETEIETEVLMAIRIEEDPEVAPGGARLPFQGLTDQPILDLSLDPSSVHSSLAESLGTSPYGQSSVHSQDLGLGRVGKPGGKMKGQHISSSFVQHLAWKCCKLKSVPGFVHLESINLEEEESPEPVELASDLGVYLIEDLEEGSPDEEDTTGIYVEGTKRFDEPTAAVDEPTREVNIGTEAEPKMILISANLDPQEEASIIAVLKDYPDGFAWTYEDMPGLD